MWAGHVLLWTFCINGRAPAVWFIKVSYTSTGFMNALIYRHNDGGSTHLWHVDLLQQEYTVPYPKRLIFNSILLAQYNTRCIIHRTLAHK
jgi:hypothetical protein